MRPSRGVAIYRLRQLLRLSVPQSTYSRAIVRLLLERTHLVLIVARFPHLAFLRLRRERGDARSSQICRVVAALVSLLRHEGNRPPVVWIGIIAGLLIHEVCGSRGIPGNLI